MSCISIKTKSLLTLSFFLGIVLFSSPCVQAQQIDNDSKLINEYIYSKGYKNTIVFDAANIKQFWIDKSVLSRNEEINITLNKTDSLEWKSIPLKIQLANVAETLDCRVDVLTNDPTASFSVTNIERKALSSSASQDPFIQYSVLSSSFHLEDTNDFSFNLQFASKGSDSLKIKKVILSFSENKGSKYLSFPQYDQVLKDIDEKGISVPDTEIKYVISEDSKKIFLKVPDYPKSHLFFYHIYPLDKNDLEPDRRGKSDFNNLDNEANKIEAIIPRPILSKSKFTILQLHLPSYQFSYIRIGQYASGKNIWRYDIKDDDVSK